MHFSTAAFFSAFVALAVAQNPFTRTSYTGITAGTPTNITWSPTTSGTVSLKLVQGDPSALTTVGTIASSIPNSGSFVWTPSSSIVQGSTYALEIISDSNTNIINYTPQFSIASTNTNSASSSGASSTGTASSTGSTSSGANSTTGSRSATSSASTMTTGLSSMITRASSTSSPSSTAASVSKNAAAAATAQAKIGAGVLGLVGAVMMAL